MKSRKLLALLLGLIMCLSTFSGCSFLFDDEEEMSGDNSGGNSSEIEELKQMIKDLSAEIEELRGALTLPEGAMVQEALALSEEDSAKLDAMAEEQQRVLRGSVKTSIKQRDWDKYASRSAKDKLTYSESAFYDRLDEVCRQYLENSSTSFIKQNNFYTIARVDYKDLNLSRERAGNLVTWFKYNNPQYYFLAAGYAFTSQSIYVQVFDFAANLSDFGKTTNELFDKLDKWISECSDDETTNWQKLMSANRTICEAIIYDPVVSNKDNKYTQEQSTKAAGEENQSMYSVLMTPETVCAGYAQTLTAMGNAMNIDVLTALSYNHAWNTVKFDDGNYYYIDVCWNDEDNGYNTEWFGVGSLFANDKSHIYESTTAANWAPAIEANNYKVTAADMGKDVKTLGMPSPTVVGSGNTGVKISWSAVNDAQQYQVQAYCDGNVVSNILTADTTRYIPYSNGADSMKIMVRAKREDDGVAAYSDWAEITTSDKGSGTSPAVPTNLKAGTSTNGGLSLSWDNPTGTSVLFGFGSDSTMTKATMAYGVKNKITFTTWNPTETTYFRLAATTASGGKETISEPLTFTYSKSEGIKVIESESAKPAVEAPGNFRVSLIPATDTEGRIVRIQWNSVSGATGYDFEGAYVSDFSKISASHTAKSTTTTLNITSISDKAHTYYVRLRTIKGSGTSAEYSQWVTAEVAVPELTVTAPEKPAAPQNLSGKESGDKKTISWDKVEGADGYVITLYKDSARTEIRKEFNTTDTTITLSPFVAGKTYYFAIRSVAEKNGNQAYSDYVKFHVTFKGDTPAVPQNVSGRESGDKEIITWDAVDGATKYVVTLYRDSTKKEIWREFDTTEPTITLSPFVSGRTYYFAIRAVKTVDGKDNYSDYANFRFTFSGSSAAALAKPQNVKSTKEGTNWIFSWDAVDGATGYTVTLYKNAAMSEVRNEFKTEKTSLKIGPFTTGNTYYFSIQATKDDGKTASEKYTMKLTF
ncbi:MAG: hypothetical protein ACI4JY_09240 [Oscillospiraceae bacterium]